MKDAIIYARISTNKDEQNLKQQIEYCKKWAEREGYKVLKVFKDEMSGKISERRGYQRMLIYLKNNPKIILIVHDTDRTSRNYYDSVEFEKFIINNKIKVVSLSEVIDLDSPNGRLMFRIKCALNAYYVENLVDKIRVGVARSKKEGKYKGRKKGSKNRK
jgi:DNA invertase Pin-like site-specific DNA recombinase